MDNKMRAGGVVVKEWDNYFLRDDSEIRKGDPFSRDQVEGYSLFRIEPYGRVVVFGGSLEWALKQAEQAIKKDE